MEIYEQLNYDLQMHVMKMHMRHNVLLEFMVYVETPFKCKSCAINGLPCVYCADECYSGTLGPPFVNGMRTFVKDFRHYFNVINYMLCRRLAIKEVHSVDDLQRRERQRFTPYSCYSVVN